MLVSLDVTLYTYYLVPMSVLAIPLHPLPFTDKSPFQRCFDGTNGFRAISPTRLERVRRRFSADSIGQLRRGAAPNCSRRGAGRWVVWMVVGTIGVSGSTEGLRIRTQ